MRLGIGVTRVRTPHEWRAKEPIGGIAGSARPPPSTCRCDISNRDGHDDDDDDNDGAM
jgi:hypothetical protein